MEFAFVGVCCSTSEKLPSRRVPVIEKLTEAAAASCTSSTFVVSRKFCHEASLACSRAFPA